jgi:hypothetical protein
VIASPQDVIAAISAQYRIFAFTVFLCGASFVWLFVDIGRSILRRDSSWLRRHSLEASWIIVGVAVFLIIHIKFPNYFIYTMIPLLVYLGMRIQEVVSPWLAANHRHPKWVRGALIAALVLLICFDLGESYYRFVVQSDNALLQVATYAQQTFGSGDRVIADEPVGTLIPEQYCKLEDAQFCTNAKWIVTYVSLTEQLPTRASDPELYVLLGESHQVAVFHGFKETITVYKVSGGSGQQTSRAAPSAAHSTLANSVPTGNHYRAYSIAWRYGLAGPSEEGRVVRHV